MSDEKAAETAPERPTAQSQDTVSEMYYQAQRQYQQVKDSKLPANDSAHQANVMAARDGFLQVYKAVKTSGVFSSNEELDDINTVDLKYLLVPFYLGDLCLAVTDMDRRLTNVQAAVAYFNAFLKQAADFKVMSKEDEAVYRRGDKPVDATTQRAERIARFKAEQATKQRLEALLQQRAQKRKASGKLDDDTEENDDDQRQFLLVTLDSCAKQALQNIGFCKQEIELLKHRQQVLKDEAGRDPSKVAPPQQSRQPPPKPQLVQLPPDGPVQLMNLQQLQGTLRVVNAPTVSSTMQQAIMRSQARELVFRDPNPPTMSMDEMLEIERKMGKIPTPSSEPAKKPNPDQEEEEPEEQSEAAQDQATLEARKWDDWKDDHEKGLGNRMRGR